MAHVFFGRKAIAFSIVLHLLGFLVAGYVVARMQEMPPLKEEIMEFDVIGAAAGNPESEQTAVLPAPAPEPAPEPEETKPEPEPQPVPPQEEEAPVVEEEKVPPPPVTNDLPKSPAVAAAGKRVAMGKPPVVISRAYPSAAEKNGFTGTIVLKVQILENGLPGNIRVAVSAGHKSYNDAAIAAARKWRFKPAQDHEGHPMVCSTIIAIPFK